MYCYDAMLVAFGNKENEGIVSRVYVSSERAA